MGFRVLQLLVYCERFTEWHRYVAVISPELTALFPSSVIWVECYGQKRVFCFLLQFLWWSH